MTYSQNRSQRCLQTHGTSSDLVFRQIVRSGFGLFSDSGNSIDISRNSRRCTWVQSGAPQVSIDVTTSCRRSSNRTASQMCPGNSNMDLLEKQKTLAFSFSHRSMTCRSPLFCWGALGVQNHARHDFAGDMSMIFQTNILPYRFTSHPVFKENPGHFREVSFPEHETPSFHRVPPSIGPGERSGRCVEVAHLVAGESAAQCEPLGRGISGMGGG